MSKKLINLLRHGCLPREDDGAIELWRIKDYLQNLFVYSQHWSDEKWKSSVARGGNKTIFQYCPDSSGAVLYLQVLQGHSGRNLIGPSLQGNVVILDGFFKYVHHVGCAINLHSIINSGLIPGGQNLSKRQTVFFLPVDLWIRNTRIQRRSTWEHRVWHSTCIKHGRNIKNTVCWVGTKLAQKKGLKFYQTRSNAIILYNTLPAHCIPKVVRMETGEIILRKKSYINKILTASTDFFET